MAEEINGDTWDECRKHVLHELRRLYDVSRDHHDVLVEMRTDVAKIDTSIAVLKLRYAIYGGLLGAIPGIIALIWQLSS